MIKTEEQKVKEKRKKLATAEFLENFWQPLDTIGQAWMGNWWRGIYETVQDAILLCLFLAIPGWMGKLILKADYSSFDQCNNSWHAWNMNRYACYAIVGSGFVFWVMFTGRIIGRTINNIYQKKKN